MAMTGGKEKRKKKDTHRLWCIVLGISGFGRSLGK